MSDSGNRPKVGVGVLVWREDGALLMELRKGSHGCGKWSIPGGHLEAGESVEVCAARELLEETGIVAKCHERDVYTLTHVPDAGTYVTLYAYTCVPMDTKAEIQELDKCAELRWVDVDEDLPGPLFEPFAKLVNQGFPRMSPIRRN